MFNCLGQLYSETIQIGSGVLFILPEMNAWGNNAHVCKQSRHGGQQGWEEPSAYPRCLSPVVCLFVTVPLCTYVVDSRKSSQILMFPIINQYKSQWNSRLGALDLFFYIRDNASYPERQKSSLWHTKRVTDLTMALLIYSYLFVHSTKQFNIVRTQLWAKQCSASC